MDRYAALRRDFAWRIPETFNIGSACSDLQPARRTAVVDLAGDRRELDFGALSDLSGRLAAALVGLGLAPGQPVAIVLPQSLETVVAHVAVYKAGGVVLPLTTLFGDDALAFRLGDSGTRVVITDTEHHDRLRDAVEHHADVRFVVVGSQDPQVGFEHVLSGASRPMAPIRTRAEDPALMIYTSGTTGAPKGALHAHRVLLGHLPGFEHAFGGLGEVGEVGGGAEVGWTPADWAWIGGLYDLVMPTLFHGGAVVASRRRGFDPEAAMAILADEGVSAAFIPPTGLRMLADGVTSAPRTDRLRGVITGGEPLDEATAAWGAEVLRRPITEMYGQTEANFLAGGSPHWPRTPGRLGRAYPGHDLVVVDDDGTEVGPGEEGELALRLPDPVAMLGYWGRPEATEAKTRDGLLWTGDRVERDEHGEVRFVARADDVINSAGFRIGPSEVEDCLRLHPEVLDAAVVGVPDEVRGQRVKAFLVRRPDSTTDPSALEEELQGLVKQLVGRYQYPREFGYLDELPRTTTGKLRRVALRPDGT